MAAAGWRIDFTAWPRSIDIGTASGAVDWVAPSTAPGDLAALVTVDLDGQGRCVGFEVWDRAALESAPTATTGLEPVMPPEPLDGGTHRTLDKWLRSLRVIAGSGDPHASVHWSRRRAYDVSAGLDDPDIGADEWVVLGVGAEGRLAAFRFLDPIRTVRGLG